MLRSKILVALDEESVKGSVLKGKLTQLCAQLAEHGYDMTIVDSASDAVAFVTSQPDVAAAIVSWDLKDKSATFVGEKYPAEPVLRVLLDRFSAKLPVFLVTNDDYIDEVPLWISEVINGWIWLLEDTADFIAGRINVAARKYQNDIMPPFFGKLRNFNNTHEYSWHTPTHAGGVAFLKSPVGRAYFDYYGERLFRTDLSVSVGELGSLFEHTGPVGDAERNSAKVFGADHTYYVLHGTSTADRLIIHATVAQNEIVLLDRNCHKAINHGITIAGAQPVYLMPTRNGYGLTGPIPAGRMAAGEVASSIEKSSLRKNAVSGKPAYAVITNSTYDGLCYNVPAVANLLGKSVPNLHFDEAWFAYARFNPLYDDRYAMSISPRVDGLTVFSSQSTHKLLAALSQSSMIHVKEPADRKFSRSQFEETFMMHATTSPLYPMIASLDVATGMMEGAGGQWLTNDAITEAIRFRQAMVRLAIRFEEDEERESWFFGVWQPPEVLDRRAERRISFAEAPLGLLRTQRHCWTLAPDADWHGFPEMTPDFCMLDPVKVTITCPGVNAKGVVDLTGIPARIVTAYLETRGIFVEKTDVYSFLVLFSIGITKGKWGTLLDALTDFKKFYDDGVLVDEILPDLVAEHAERYGGRTLKSLCTEMHQFLSEKELTKLVSQAFSDAQQLPVPAMTPAEAYQKLIRNGTEQVKLSVAAGRVAATQVATTPPGIPVLMPGERIGVDSSPLVQYLKVLEAFDKNFPGFASETHGVHRAEDGSYQILCVKEQKS